MQSSSNSAQLLQYKQLAQSQLRAKPMTDVSVEWVQREVARQLQNQSGSSVKQEKKGRLMEEFRSYVREYKDWIFTIVIVAIVDHFFLDGALKEKLSAALGKKLDATPEGKSGGA